MNSVLQRAVSKAFLVLLMLAAPCAAALEAPDRALIRAVVEATSDPAGTQADMDAEVERLEGRIDAIVERLGDGKPSGKRARRLHQLLHRDYLRTYDRDADTLSRVLDDGAFNCLSASLLFGTIARSLGYRTLALSDPGHLRIRLGWEDRTIDVETTLPGGFDAGRRGSHAEPGGIPQRDTSVGVTPGTAMSDASSLGISLEAAVGFAWLNRSWHDLDRGASVSAALGVRRALSRLPPAADQVDGARMLLARAFSVEYDAGRFDDAFEVAAIDAGLFPEKTTVRDRLVAAAIKRIELDCEADDPARALEVIDAVKHSLGGAPELGRLERRTYPGMAAAAVRLGDWGLARVISDRYAAVQPDPHEAARLSDWVETRRDPSSRSRTEDVGETPPVLIF